MNSSTNSIKSTRAPRHWWPTILAIAFMFLAGSVCPRLAKAQAVESANSAHARLAAGVAVSGFHLDYGDRKLLGITAWVDADTTHRFGFEGELRRLDYHQFHNVHAETYLAGVRYHFNYGRTQPYVKALAGDGHFNFPYNFATGNYLVIAGGAGLDYYLTRRIVARADVEYQKWPEFTFGSMSSAGGTIGVRYTIF